MYEHAELRRLSSREAIERRHRRLPASRRSGRGTGPAAALYNPETVQFENVESGSGSILLQGGSSNRRWVVIGTDNHMNNFLKNNK